MDDRRSLKRTTLALAALAVGVLALSAWPRAGAHQHADADTNAHEHAHAHAHGHEHAHVDGQQRVAEAPEHPHPITAEHLALYRDVDMLDAAWHAMRDGDYAGARVLLAEHAREFPREHDDMNEGLSLLADCMEQRTETARDRVQRFYDTETYSMVRRRLRRHCLEPLASGEAVPPS